MPKTALRCYQRMAAKYLMNLEKGKSSKDIFRKIYVNSKWGKSDDGFCSGWGSIGRNATQYVDFINEFISSHDSKTVVDLGCGDFKVGRRLQIPGGGYLGCDVVPEVIAENIKKFSSEKIGFKCIDIINDELPDGELCLIRQVLQHLSNSDILSIIPKIKKYNYVIISDMQIYDPKSINLDIQRFGGERTKLASNLLLEMPPFNLAVEPVLEYKLPDNSEYYLRSVLLTNI